ncbi:MAG: cold shock domain-containing protein [Pseudomonadales bacterium]|nr:cold shock domain-containing protein [Pseudomonadales bacterium]
MTNGTVKWFNNTKGYGFVRAEGRDDDLFVHYSYIQMDGYRSLKAGQAVEFDEVVRDHGLHAINLRCKVAAQVHRQHEATA